MRFVLSHASFDDEQLLLFGENGDRSFVVYTADDGYGFKKGMLCDLLTPRDAPMEWDLVIVINHQMVLNSLDDGSFMEVIGICTEAALTYFEVLDALNDQ